MRVEKGGRREKRRKEKKRKRLALREGWEEGEGARGRGARGAVAKRDHLYGKRWKTLSYLGADLFLYLSRLQRDTRHACPGGRCDVVIAGRDRQDGPARIGLCPKRAPKPRCAVGVGEAGPLLVCTCQSGNCRRDPTVSTAKCWNWRHGLAWLGLLGVLIRLQSASVAPSSIQSVIHGFIKSASHCPLLRATPGHAQHPTRQRPGARQLSFLASRQSRGPRRVGGLALGTPKKGIGAGLSPRGRYCVYYLLTSGV